MLGRLALVLGSVLFCLLALEIGCRLVRGPDTLLHWQNLVLKQRLASAAENKEQRFTYDSQLGWRQRASVSSAHVNYDADGFRLTPTLPADATDTQPVLATGDSYTQGDEVDDSETWPSWLQGFLRRRVINAGVAAYGLDQTVLRTAELVPKLKPGVIVLGFIADDVRRAEMSRTWGAEKPYFELLGQELVLRNVPVPPSPDPRDTLDFWQTAFGWSILVDTVLRHQGWQYEWTVDHVRVMPRGTGLRLACPLMRRIARLGVPTLVVAEYDFYVWQNAEFAAEQRRISREVLSCAEQAGLSSLDLYEPLRQAVQTRGRDAIYRAWHPGPDGYKLIAEQIATKLATMK